MSTVTRSIPQELEYLLEAEHPVSPPGYWSEDNYLALTDVTNRLIEFTDGKIEVLTMPYTSHQLMLMFLFDALRAFVRTGDLGRVMFMGIRVRIRPGKIRYPDVIFMGTGNADRCGEDHWDGADLVMEIVSPDSKSRKRDLEEKRADYAEARIPEYWTVDPEEQRITVLTLDGDQYIEHGVFTPGEQAASQLLEGFAIDVTRVFQAAKV